MKKKAKLKLLECILYSEVTNSIESAKEFCKMNCIIPYLIIVVWDENSRWEKSFENFRKTYKMCYGKHKW